MIDSDLKDFINVTFTEGISDDQQTDLVKNIHRPGYIVCDGLDKGQSVYLVFAVTTNPDG